MATTKIEWTDYTFNPWWGCTKVSTGCKNCYAAKQSNRFGNWWGLEAERREFDGVHWSRPIYWDRIAAKNFRRFKVFSGSMCDIFERRKDLADRQYRLWELIEQTPHLDWQLLTKRPENINRLISAAWRSVYMPDNVWLGVSVENQEQANKRIPELLRIPAKIHFLSCEPLLAPLNLEFEGLNYGGDFENWRERIDWVIVGGESGYNKRPFNPDWARSIRDQCKEAGVKFFMKQTNKIDPIPSDLLIREFPE